MLVFCIKNVPLKIYFPYLVLLKNRIYIHIKWKILAWLSYDLFKFGETMTYLKKKLLHKLLAFPYLKLCSFLLHLLSDVLFSLIPGLFDLGKLHRVSCLQSLLVILHFATSCIISNSMIKNLNSDSSVSHTQMLQWMDSSTSALCLFSCYLPLYFPIVFLHQLLLSQILDILVMKQIQDSKSPCFHLGHVCFSLSNMLFPYQVSNQSLLNYLCSVDFPIFSSLYIDIFARVLTL